LSRLKPTRVAAPIEEEEEEEEEPFGCRAVHPVSALCLAICQYSSIAYQDNDTDHLQPI